MRERIAAAEAARGEIESDIEQMDGQTAPLAERRNQLDAERRKLVDRIEELTEARRRMQARKDLLDARRRDIEETPGSRFLAGHTGGAIGLLKDLVRVEPGLERALVAALGALADAVVYDDGDRALADAPQGDGAILAIAAGGPVPLGLPGEQKLLSKVEAEPAARGIVSTVLRDVYLVGDIAEAARKQTAHPQASFVTPEGVLVGPAVIHTAKEADVRLREIRAELQVLAHDLSATEQQLRPRTERLDEIAGEVAFLQEQIEAADADITEAAERLTIGERELAAMHKEEELLAQRLGVLVETADRRRASASPRWARARPRRFRSFRRCRRRRSHARVTVETLRRDRANQDHRLAELREERDQLAAHDPLLAAGGARRRRGHARRRPRSAVARRRCRVRCRHRGARRRRHRGARGRRARGGRQQELARCIHRARRAARAATRTRIVCAATSSDGSARPSVCCARASRSTRQRCVATLTDDDTVETIEKKQELVQRRLALLGRVNLLATGELESLQERHDFMQRELDDVRKARRDLLEVIAQIDQQITESFTSAYQDVAIQFERLIGELFPGGEGRLVLTDPAEPAGIRHRDRGEPGPQARQADLACFPAASDR